MSDAPIPPGTTLGAFVVEALLGRGGMGAVYRVRNRITGELRALKVVRPDLLADAALRQRFEREMRLAASVVHPNVVRVYEPAMDGDTLLLPMELIQGESLAAWLRTPAGRRTLAERDALALMIPLCDGVGALHAAGIVHRDLKPGNVMLAPGVAGFVPKVIDLGAALEVARGEDLTRQGLVVGTPVYLSVEQASGARDLDPRADVYALGVVLYEMLAGRRPYEGASDEEVFLKVAHRAPFPPLTELAPAVSPALAAAVVRALSFDREGRPRDARALRDALLAIVGAGREPDTLDPGRVGEPRRPAPPANEPRRRVFPFALGGALIAALALIALRSKHPPSDHAVAAAPPPALPAVTSPTPTPTPTPIEAPVEQRLASAVAAPGDAGTLAVADATPVAIARSPRPRPPASRRCRPRPGVICPP